MPAGAVIVTMSASPCVNHRSTRRVTTSPSTAVTVPSKATSMSRRMSALGARHDAMTSSTPPESSRGGPAVAASSPLVRATAPMATATTTTAAIAASQGVLDDGREGEGSDAAGSDAGSDGVSMMGVDMICSSLRRDDALVTGSVGTSGDMGSIAFNLDRRSSLIPDAPLLVQYLHVRHRPRPVVPIRPPASTSPSTGGG